MNYKKLNVKNPVLKKGVHYLTRDYMTRSRDSHKGIDLIGDGYAIDDIIAIENGLVIASKYSNSFGNYVEIKHNNEYISRYLHMKNN